MRKGALFTALAIAAGSLSLTPSVAQAAPGDFTETTTSASVPAGSGVTTISRVYRVASTDELIVFGNAGTNTDLNMWKLKADRTIDATFGTNGVVNLGAALSVANSTQRVSELNNALIDERGKKILFSINYYPSLTVNGTNTSFQSAIFGQIDLATGALTSVSRQVGYSAGGTGVTYATSIGFESKMGETCTAAYGATVAGIPMSSTYGGSQLMARPDGSMVTTFECMYSNTSTISSGNPGVVKERQGTLMVAFKPSGSSMTIDTSFGTNGYIARPDVATTCGYQYFSNTDTGITSTTSTQMFTVLSRDSSPLSTSGPSWVGNIQGATGYEGCYNAYGSGSAFKSYPMLANGTIKAEIALPTGVAIGGQFVIDPAGRWVTIGRDTGGNPSSMKYYAVRLLNTGVVDTTYGTGGAKELNIPSTINIGGASRQSFVNLSGMITTLDEVYFAGFYQYNNWPMGSCTGSYSTHVRPFVLSLKTGTFLPTYGESGIGKEFSQSGTWSSCGDRSTLSRFVARTGRPTAISLSGSSIRTAVWESVTGATGGGEGGSGTGGKTNDTGGKPFGGEGTGLSNVDTKVYSKLPKATAENLAFRALTRAEAKSAELVSLTPKVCVVFSRSILTINTGRCRVEVRDQATDEVLRRLTTLVKEDGSSAAGSTADQVDPILFSEASAKLSKDARAALKDLVDQAKEAGTIVVVGHSASLTENDAANRLISLNRARNVRLAMIKAGVKVPIQVVALGSKAPAETKKSEKAQAQNRRVEIYFLPAPTPAS